MTVSILLILGGLAESTRAFQQVVHVAPVQLHHCDSEMRRVRLESVRFKDEV